MRAPRLLENGAVLENMRTERLRKEMFRRMNAGWDPVERSAFRLVMTHATAAPWWDFWAWRWNWGHGPDVTLEVTVDESGKLHRLVTGEPPRWRRRPDWLAFADE